MRFAEAKQKVARADRSELQSGAGERRAGVADPEDDSERDGKTEHEERRGDRQREKRSGQGQRAHEHLGRRSIRQPWCTREGAAVSTTGGSGSGVRVKKTVVPCPRSDSS